MVPETNNTEARQALRYTLEHQNLWGCSWTIGKREHTVESMSQIEQKTKDPKVPHNPNDEFCWMYIGLFIAISFEKIPKDRSLSHVEHVH